MSLGQWLKNKATNSWEFVKQHPAMTVGVTVGAAAGTLAAIAVAPVGVPLYTIAAFGGYSVGFGSVAGGSAKVVEMGSNFVVNQLADRKALAAAQAAELARKRLEKAYFTEIQDRVGDLLPAVKHVCDVSKSSPDQFLRQTLQALLKDSHKPLEDILETMNGLQTNRLLENDAIRLGAHLSRIQATINRANQFINKDYPAIVAERERLVEEDMKMLEDDQQKEEADRMELERLAEEYYNYVEELAAYHQQSVQEYEEAAEPEHLVEDDMKMLEDQQKEEADRMELEQDAEAYLNYEDELNAYEQQLIEEYEQAERDAAADRQRAIDLAIVPYIPPVQFLNDIRRQTIVNTINQTAAHDGLQQLNSNGKRGSEHSAEAFEEVSRDRQNKKRRQERDSEPTSGYFAVPKNLDRRARKARNKHMLRYANNNG